MSCLSVKVNWIGSMKWSQDDDKSVVSQPNQLIRDTIFVNKEIPTNESMRSNRYTFNIFILEINLCLAGVSHTALWQHTIHFTALTLYFTVNTFLSISYYKSDFIISQAHLPSLPGKNQPLNQHKHGPASLYKLCMTSISCWATWWSMLMRQPRPEQEVDVWHRFRLQVFQSSTFVGIIAWFYFKNLLGYISSRSRKSIIKYIY